ASAAARAPASLARTACAVRAVAGAAALGGIAHRRRSSCFASAARPVAAGPHRPHIAHPPGAACTGCAPPAPAAETPGGTRRHTGSSGMIALSLLLSFCAFSALSLAMNRHHQQVFGRAVTPRRQTLLRAAGALLLVLAIPPAVKGW